jgi:hypothetical protein
MRLFGKVDNVVDSSDRPHFMGEIFDRTFYHVFPTLSRGPIREGHSERVAHNPTISSEFATGATKTRPMFTRLRDVWRSTYRHMPQADKALIKDFQEEVGVGSAKFYWTNEQDNTSHFVRFVGEPIVFELEPGFTDHWRFDITVMEI